MKKRRKEDGKNRSKTREAGKKKKKKKKKKKHVHIAHHTSLKIHTGISNPTALIKTKEVKKWSCSVMSQSIVACLFKGKKRNLEE